MEERQTLSSVNSSLSFSFPRHIHRLSLPRFSISSYYQLEDILSQLGMKKIFTSDADFSGITDDHKLAVSQVSLNFAQFILFIGA